MTLSKNFVVWILFFTVGQNTLEANAYEKCSTLNDCEHFLTEKDMKNAAINGLCTQKFVPGTCIISYSHVPSIGYEAKPKDPVAPGCTKLNSSWVKTCEKAVQERRQEYPALSQKIANVYTCNGTTDQGKNVTYLTCSSQASIKIKDDKSITKSKSGCSTSADCVSILSETDQMNHGIFKDCFNAEEGCKAPKSCDHACAFVYSKLDTANEAARNPNPKNCTVPAASKKAKIDKICDNFLELELNQKLTPNTKNTLYKTKGFICKPKNYIACVAQIETKVGKNQKG